MTDVPDADLLKQFVRDRSEAAFAALVERHIGLVHSIALRHTTNPQHAQDITQVVFIILARKAAALNRKTILPGWLHQTARLVAANFQRAEIRRIRREQEVFMQSTLNESAPDPLWSELSPLLDEALSRLRASDRDALVLRYFQNKSLAEVGAAMGLAERAAQKRILRAIEKLRTYFAKRGVTNTADEIAKTISANSVQAVSPALVKAVAATAFAKGATASTSILTLTKGALKIMAWTKAKTAVVAGVALILATGTTTVIVRNSIRPSVITTQMFRAENARQAIAGKQMAIAFILYAQTHQNQLPKRFDQLESGLPKDISDWEIVSTGNLVDFAPPAEPARLSRTILLREKEARQSSDGAFARVYVFADGHVEIVSSPDNEFAALEKQRGYLRVTGTHNAPFSNVGAAVNIVSVTMNGTNVPMSNITFRAIQPIPPDTNEISK